MIHAEARYIKPACGYVIKIWDPYQTDINQIGMLQHRALHVLFSGAEPYETASDSVQCSLNWDGHHWLFKENA